MVRPLLAPVPNPLRISIHGRLAPVCIYIAILLLAAGCNRQQGSSGIASPTASVKPSPGASGTPEATVVERKIIIDGLDSVAITHPVNLGLTSDPNAFVPDPIDDDKDVHPTAKISTVQVYDSAGALKHTINCAPRLCSVKVDVNGAGDIEVEGLGIGLRVDFNRNKYRPRLVGGKMEHYKKTATFKPGKLQVEFGGGIEENIPCADSAGNVKCRIVVSY